MDMRLSCRVCILLYTVQQLQMDQQAAILLHCLEVFGTVTVPLVSIHLVFNKMQHFYLRNFLRATASTNFVRQEARKVSAGCNARSIEQSFIACKLARV